MMETLSDIIIGTEKTKRVIAWLQLCYEMLEQGREDEIPQDPWYKSKRGELTDDYVERVVAKIDKEFEREIRHHPDYHRRLSGATTTPDFYRMSRKAKRAMVEGLDRALGNEEVGQ